jgi:hypothetical protein
LTTTTEIERMSPRTAISRRYVAFLRGVTPMNAKMLALKAAFEAAGFTDVRTVLSSGNVLFTAPGASEGALERKAETAMRKRLGRVFPTIVRSVDAPQSLRDRSGCGRPRQNLPNAGNESLEVAAVGTSPSR